MRKKEKRRGGRKALGACGFSPGKKETLAESAVRNRARWEGSIGAFMCITVVLVLDVGESTISARKHGDGIAEEGVTGH